jgi:hypothetical protein
MSFFIFLVVPKEIRLIFIVVRHNADACGSITLCNQLARLSTTQVVKVSPSETYINTTTPPLCT